MKHLFDLHLQQELQTSSLAIQASAFRTKRATRAFFPHLAIMHRPYAFLNWLDDAAGQYYQQMVVIICSIEAGNHF